MGMIFLFYVSFINIVVFNVLTAIFVENVMKLCQPDEDQMAVAWTEERRATHEQIQKIVHHMDLDESGSITWEEFQAFVNDPYVASEFDSLKLDMSNAEMFFRTLCT